MTLRGAIFLQYMHWAIIKHAGRLRARKTRQPWRLDQRAAGRKGALAVS